MDPATAICEALAGFPDLRIAILFGSLARGEARLGSDIDLAVLAGDPLSSATICDIVGAVAEATGRPVDLVDLTRTGEPLLGEILRHGRFVLESDPEARADLVRRHIFESTDFLPYRRRVLAERRRAWLSRHPIRPQKAGSRKSRNP